MTAEPLPIEDAVAMVDEDLAELLVLIDGRLYDKQDLFSCRSCVLVTPNLGDLHDDGECDHCARETRQWKKHLVEEAEMYRTRVL